MGPRCPLGVKGGMAFSSLRDRSAREIRLDGVFLFAPPVFANASCWPNENIARPALALAQVAGPCKRWRIPV